MSRAMGRNREDLEAGWADILPGKRRAVCALASIAAVIVFTANASHLLVDLPIWLVMGIVGIGVYMMKYGDFHLRSREADAGEEEDTGERLRRTLSNLPAIRVRLATTDRDFDELDYEDLRLLDEGVTPEAPSTSEGDFKSRYMVNSHVYRLSSQDSESACVVCLEQFNSGEITRRLCCLHQFHLDCVDHWLREQGVCPVCKFRVFHENGISEAENMV